MKTSYNGKRLRSIVVPLEAGFTEPTSSLTICWINERLTGHIFQPQHWEQGRDRILKYTQKNFWQFFSIANLPWKLIYLTNRHIPGKSDGVCPYYTPIHCRHVCVCVCVCSIGRDSSVGISPRWELDGLGIGSRWRQNFPHPFTHTQPPIQWIPSLSRG